MSFYFLSSAVIFQLFPIADLRYQFVTQALWAEWWVLWTPSGQGQQQISVHTVHFYFSEHKSRLGKEGTCYAG